MDKFVTLHLTGVPSDKYDLVCSQLFDDGAQGVSENLNFIQESQQYDPEIIEKDLKSLEAYFAFENLDLENLDLENLKISYSDYAPSLKEEFEKDWMSEWKKHYKPFEAAPDVWIYPSWIEPELEPTRQIIKIDPGLAFGTGTRATTLMCLQKIQEVFALSPLNSVLDVGAGTGILSILCSKYGFKDITATEIDEMAREKCQENLDLNDVKARVLAPEETDFLKAYDLVVANIIDGVLLKIKEDLLSACSNHLILSGVLRENEEALKKAFLSEDGFSLVSTHYLEEWCLFHIKRD